MNDSIPAGALAILVLLAGLILQPMPVRADPAVECREEAKLYGVPQEQFAEYVDGCVLSRGGYPDIAADSGENSMPDALEDPDMMPAPVEELPEEAVVQEGEYGTP